MRGIAFAILAFATVYEDYKILERDGKASTKVAYISAILFLAAFISAVFGL